MPATAKIFMNGKSQAVRLPKEFRFDGDEVRIRHEGNTVILEPIEKDWSWLSDVKALGPLDQDVLDAIEEKQPEQNRPELDVFN